MPSYEFIESAIIANLDNKYNLKDFKFSVKDFAKHGDAYKFIVKHFDQYGEFPSFDVLSENFPTLDKTAQSVNFDYAVKTFKDQVLTRKVTKVVRGQADLVKDNPKQTISNIMVGLTDIEVDYDEDVQAYDTGELDRLDEYKKRAEKRKMGDGLMGIPTSFQTINSTGVGWMSGELVAMFARPTIGKTWMCVHSAAVAIKEGFRTLLISTEMPDYQMKMRLDVVLGKMMGYDLSHTALRRGDKIDEDNYAKFLQEANSQSLLVCDHISGQVGISTEAIASLIRKHQPEFVVIDGVYLVTSGDAKKAIWEQSHSLFYGLKNLATSMGLPIMVTTQATREASNMFTPPRADQVAFGDALIRAADVAMAMCALENADDKRMVQFQKYRDGQLPRDLTVMQWNVDNGDIIELPDYDIYDKDEF
jgi:replicative DNA helicase